MPAVVEGLDHRAELAVGVVARDVGVMERTPRQWHVAPVVALVGVELVDRQQFDRGDAQFDEVRHDVAQPGDHRNAAGCTLTGDWDEAERTIVRLLKDAVERRDSDIDTTEDALVQPDSSRSHRLEIRG